jgi:hypothetical protein
LNSADGMNKKTLEVSNQLGAYTPSETLYVWKQRPLWDEFHEASQYVLLIVHLFVVHRKPSNLA